MNSNPENWYGTIELYFGITLLTHILNFLSWKYESLQSNFSRNSVVIQYPNHCTSCLKELLSILILPYSRVCPTTSKLCSRRSFLRGLSYGSSPLRCFYSVYGGACLIETWRENILIFEHFKLKILIITLCVCVCKTNWLWLALG